MTPHAGGGRPNRPNRRSGLHVPSCGLLVFLLIAASVFGQGDTYKDIRIPSGAAFTFPTAESTLNLMRGRQDTGGIRAHAWSIFSGLVQPAVPGDPESVALWETWYHRNRELQMGCLHQDLKIVRHLDVPLELIANFAVEAGNDADSPQFKGVLDEALKFFRSPKAPGIDVLYNSAACNHIRGLGLQDPSTNQDILAAESLLLDKREAPAAERDIPQFPSTAIVVKAIWDVIPKDGTNFFTIWRSGKGAVSIRIAPAKGLPCKLGKKLLDTIPTSCFYSVPLPDGDVLVLEGMHVITKEVADWTWSTFWWTDTPDDATYGSDRPGSKIIPGVWRNYVMDTTLSATTPWEMQTRPICKDGTIPNPDNPTGNVCEAKPSCKLDDRSLQDSPRSKISFNPYLEGLSGSLTQSNCMNCHKMATFPSLNPDPLLAPQRGYLGSDADCFRNHIRLDYQWSLVAPGSNASQLFKFDKALQELLQVAPDIK